jgi:hypothetical protein
MILADAAFTQIVSARLDGTRIAASPLGRSPTPANLARALSCEG